MKDDFGGDMENENILTEILNQEIVRELLMEIDSEISDERVKFIWSHCENNPWNAPVMHKLLP